MRRLRDLPDPAPTPDGDPLTVVVPCSTRPDLGSATCHPVTLDSSWSLATPHDLAAERVAVAFGGYSSCLVLDESVVGAVRDAVARHARRRLPRLTRGARGTWRPTGPDRGPCCGTTVEAAEAAEHLRGMEHAVGASKAPPALVRVLFDAVVERHRGASTFQLGAAGVAHLQRCVRGASGGPMLWDAGLHPDVVALVHDTLVGADGPALPPSLYLGVVSRRPDLDWVAATIAAVKGGPVDPSLADWLAWTQTPLDRRSRQARIGWLYSGAPRAWIETLSGAGYTPTDGQRLAEATGRSVVAAADLLLAWVRADCRPAVDDLLRLRSGGLPLWGAPSKAAVTRLRDDLGPDGAHLTRTDMGLLIARHGTVPAAEAAVRGTDDRIASSTTRRSYA